MRSIFLPQTGFSAMRLIHNLFGVADSRYNFPLCATPKSPSPPVPQSPSPHIFHPQIQQSHLFFLLVIVATILTKTVWIYSTANVGRSSVVATTQIANYIADTFDVLLFGISSYPLVSSIGGRFCCCQPSIVCA